MRTQLFQQRSQDARPTRDDVDLLQAAHGGHRTRSCTHQKAARRRRQRCAIGTRVADVVEASRESRSQLFGQAGGGRLATVADVYGVEQAQVVRDTFCQLRIRSTREHDLATVVAARLESRDEGPAIGKNRRIELAGQRDALLHSC